MSFARSLAFANLWINCTLIEAAQERLIEDAIVVNLSATPVAYRAGTLQGIIFPFTSKKLRNCTITNGERLAVFSQEQRENLGGLGLKWRWLGDIYQGFSKNTPLYISPEDDVAEIELNAGKVFCFSGQERCQTKRYRLKLKLWYAPPLTDCSIHFEHSFLEVHTQIVGTGHMQKFQTADAETLFEDVLCPPGATHEPFFQFSDERGFHYPQHRYFAETECVWLAIELHPIVALEGSELQ